MSNDEFTSFESLMNSNSIQLPPKSRVGNIIKSAAADSDATPSHAQAAVEHDKPQIIVHRKGDRIDRIEFVCVCGRSSEVVLEYDGE